MGRMAATLIDVGWGDSIFLEFEDGDGVRYGLVDSNDTTTLRSSYIFLKRFFEKKGLDLDSKEPFFEFVLLSHWHADHLQGLKGLLREFGARRVWYPKMHAGASGAYLLDYCNRSSRVEFHEALDAGKLLPPVGGCGMRVLWPPQGHVADDENNNSVVVELRLGDVAFLLCGDAEAEVWRSIGNEIREDTRFVKVPHHGSANGSLDGSVPAAWVGRCLQLPQKPYLGISSHVRPFRHPSPEVVDLFGDEDFRVFRTDEHYHVTVETEGRDVRVQYSRI